jgi:plasmid stability protein
VSQILVRNIPDHVMQAFKNRAVREGVSAEALARMVLAQAAQRPDMKAAIARMRELRAMTPAPIDESLDVLRAIRDGRDAGD